MSKGSVIIRGFHERPELEAPVQTGCDYYNTNLNRRFMQGHTLAGVGGTNNIIILQNDGVGGEQLLVEEIRIRAGAATNVLLGTYGIAAAAQAFGANLRIGGAASIIGRIYDAQPANLANVTTAINLYGELVPGANAYMELPHFGIIVENGTRFCVTLGLQATALWVTFRWREIETA